MTFFACLYNRQYARPNICSDAHGLAGGGGGGAISAVITVTDSMTLEITVGKGGKTVRTSGQSSSSAGTAAGKAGGSSSIIDSSNMTNILSASGGKGGKASSSVSQGGTGGSAVISGDIFFNVLTGIGKTGQSFSHHGNDCISQTVSGSNAGFTISNYGKSASGYCHIKNNSKKSDDTFCSSSGQTGVVHIKSVD